MLSSQLPPLRLSLLSYMLHIITRSQWLPEVGSVRLSESAVTLTIGGSIRLSATVEPSGAEYGAIIRTSSNPSVVAVSGGSISARSVGTVTITSTTSDSSKNASCTVKVSSIDPFISIPYANLKTSSRSKL